LDEDYTYEEFYELFGNGSTFPQVVMDDIPLGGCQDSLRYMQENNLCCEIL
jgi:glutaredoxin